MTSPTAATQPLHILRGILRHLKTHCPSSSIGTTTGHGSNKISEQSLRSLVIQQYRASRSASPESASKLTALAQEQLNLLNDLTERKRLHELDSGIEVKLSPKEMSRRAAARAGLQLPETFDDEAAIREK